MIKNGNIASLFFEAASIYADSTAIIHNNESISFEDFKNEVLRTADYFKKAGIKKGDRVLIFVPMSVDLYRIVLALFSMGATAVFLDEWVSKSRMELCCKIADCKGFIGIPKAQILRLFSKELRAIPIHLKRSKRGAITQEFPVLLENDTTALMTFTTGSTGTPKAANRTHQFLHAQYIALEDKLKSNPGDIDLPALPIVLLINLGLGVTSVIYNYKPSKPKTIEPDRLVKTLKTHKVKRIVSSPDFLIRLSKHLLSKNIKLSDVEFLFTGGAPVFPDQAALLINAFPSAKTEIVYGSTEAEPISGINALDLASSDISIEKGLPVGKISHFAEVKIIAINDSPIHVRSEDELTEIDGIGEIIVAGDHVLSSYFNNEEALFRNKIFIGNKVYHRTGDSGFIKDGKLFLTGRCNSIISYQGKTIYPFIIEQRLRTIKEVEMGTILMISEQPTLIIECNSDSRDAIQNQLFNLFDEEYPIIWYQIPRDPRHNSKIDYEQLKSLLAN